MTEEKYLVQAADDDAIEPEPLPWGVLKAALLLVAATCLAVALVIVGKWVRS